MHWNSCINVSFLIVQEWGFARSAGPVFLKAFIDSRAPSLNGKLFHGPMIIWLKNKLLIVWKFCRVYLTMNNIFSKSYFYLFRKNHPSHLGCRCEITNTNIFISRHTYIDIQRAKRDSINLTPPIHESWSNTPTLYLISIPWKTIL